MTTWVSLENQPFFMYPVAIIKYITERIATIKNLSEYMMNCNYCTYIRSYSNSWVRVSVIDSEGAKTMAFSLSVSYRFL